MSESPTAVVAAGEPRTIVIERRWAIIGASVITALVFGLAVALAFTLGDDGGDGPHGPPGVQFSMPGGAEGGYGVPPGAPPQGALPDGAQPPGGVPPSGDGAYPAPPRRRRSLRTPDRASRRAARVRPGLEQLGNKEPAPHFHTTAAPAPLQRCALVALCAPPARSVSDRGSVWRRRSRT